ncbi:bacillithiol biosynthesis cysteine-adding enzyme BshC [Ornithinibacillus scapharcae]|uniref:bacillithiol biosynthesis cysteine-adding enzyme BshC n=1 Tax=Ornithinibacillus scapharcae TaxID=1147159 RepID=UPI000225BEF6|nr:bacillithiol biosynthesis cysteine-adding enzyme BshC [Ornithinibacillus scapharcae]
MRIEPIQVNINNKLIQDYRHHDKTIMKYFDYNSMDFESRAKELKSRSYKRKQLVEVLHKLNTKWDAPTSTIENIERLMDEESLVVIGGQQAGLLTGPLYSINKVISIIQLAKQQEKKLGFPVIPVFWIAGEDHDFEEINHVFMHVDQKMKKYKVNQQNLEKRSVSHVEIEQEAVSDWVDLVMKQLAETNFTNELRYTITRCLKQSTTYVDFFARLTFQLFQHEGLVLIDSGDEAVRKLESEYFIRMIDKQNEIGFGVYNTYKELTSEGYAVPLDVTPDNGNLFYHKDFERILLHVNEEGKWVGKQMEVILSKDELLSTAKNRPELLSNNVVTRPLMQDLIFPTLAFIGGPGEISYWSVLKSAFHTLGIKMPPVVPRLSFTYIDRKIEKLLDKYAISISLALNGEITSIRERWLEDKVNPSIEESVSNIKQVITEAHTPLRQIAKDIRSDIYDLSNKNLERILREVEYLKKRMVKALEEQYDKELSEFYTLENTLYPGGFQERVWNPIPLINEFGLRFLYEITSQDLSFEEDHFVVYL